VSVIGWKDPRKKPGELLWPARITAKDTAVLKGPHGVGSYAYAAQYQQRPTPAEGGTFKRHWFRFWRPAEGPALPPVTVELHNGKIHEAIVVKLPEKFDSLRQSWDMAFVSTATSSFVVGQVWASLQADAFLLDQDRDRREFTETLEAVKRVSTAWPEATRKVVEAKANGPAVISALRSSVGSLIPFDPNKYGSKEARAVAVSPRVEGGNVYLPHPSLAPWVLDFIEECCAFPNSANNDQVDTMSQALLDMRGSLASPPSGAWGVGRNKRPWRIP